MALRRAYKGYVLGVTGPHSFWSWGSSEPIAGTAHEIAAALPARAWRRYPPAPGGATRPRLAALLGRSGQQRPALARLGLPGTRHAARRGGGPGPRREPVDPRPAHPAQPRRRELGLLHDLVPGGHAGRDPGGRRGTALGDRGRVRGRQDRTRLGAQRGPVLARLAPARLAGDAGLRHAGRGPSPGRRRAPKKPDAPAIALVRWSLQEIRRVAARLAQRRIKPTLVIAWSAWRRAHQARARQAHLKRTLQL